MDGGQKVCFCPSVNPGVLALSQEVGERVRRSFIVRQEPRLRGSRTREGEGV